MADNIKMGNVRNNKLESIADIEIKLDLFHGIYYVPESIIGEEEFSTPDYSKIIRVNYELPDKSHHYSTSEIDETYRNHVLNNLPDNLVVGNVYVFDAEDSTNSVYAYVESLDNIIIYADELEDVYDKFITIGYDVIPIWAIVDNNHSKVKINIPFENLFDLTDGFSDITVNTIVSRNNSHEGLVTAEIMNIPQCVLMIEQLEDDTASLYIGWENEYMEISSVSINMYTISSSNGKYLVGCKLYDEH